MIRVRQIKVDVGANADDIKLACANKISIKKDRIKQLKIIKQSIDARKKPLIEYVYEVDIEIDNEDQILKRKNKDIIKTPDEEYKIVMSGNKKLESRPIIVGSGPAGLFCAYFLAFAGYKPLIIERGENIEKRILTVQKFWDEGILNKNSNVQFGEGGAGTFSDGKLNSQIKDKNNRIKKMLEIFVDAGAPKEILYINNPHIGTDLLRGIVVNIRKKITDMGGEFRFNTCLTNIKIKGNKVVGIEVNNQEIIDCSLLILAIGHSASDTFQMLFDQKLKLESKPFAIGFRVQHPQSLIDNNQYGKIDDSLPRASYKLTYKASNGRGVYSFCMCPGGYVVNASSEKERLVINGMSNHNRDSGVANSAIIVTVNHDDFGTNPLDGLKYQRQLENKAYQLGQGQIPTQLWCDYKQNKETKVLKHFKPQIKGQYVLTNLNELLPNEINESLKEGISYFDTKIKGFAADDTILSAIESRTSSPIRIIRDDNLESNIKGIYPCGEGSGYAGGITSSSIDGMKVAEIIMQTYKKL